MHALQESEGLKAELIKGALEASRSVLSSLPHTEDVSALVQDLFEAFAVGPLQSDKHILDMILQLTQSKHISPWLLLHHEDNDCKMTLMCASCLQLRSQHLALFTVPMLSKPPTTQHVGPCSSCFMKLFQREPSCRWSSSSRTEAQDQ